MTALLVLSLFSWTIIITKARQLAIARRWAKRFFAAYNETRDPLEIKRKGATFEGAPAYHLYMRGADELDYHLKNYPVQVIARPDISSDPTLGHGNTDGLCPFKHDPRQQPPPLRRSRWSWRRRRRRKRCPWRRG